jgi:nucleoside-diphosphate kinase
LREKPAQTKPLVQPNQISSAPTACQDSGETKKHRPHAKRYCRAGLKSADSGYLSSIFVNFLETFHMAIERTLSIIKPDAVAKNVIGQIYSRFEGAGLKIIASRMAHLSQAEAEAFYAVHKARPFFKDLVDFMISGPVMIQVLEGESAILKNRDLMGATDPKKADKGTIRADFADSIDANAVHGSDGPDTAANEIAFFFAGLNVFNR